MAEKIGVVFICLGNICRSPMAKGLFQAKVNARGLEDRFNIDSAGTSSYHIGEPPDPGSVKVARKAGIDLSRDRARQAVERDFERFDYVIALDRSNRRNLNALKGGRNKTVWLLREFESDADGLDVPDPWGGGLRSFERAFHIVDAGVEALLARILSDHPELR